MDPPKASSFGGARWEELSQEHLKAGGLAPKDYLYLPGCSRSTLTDIFMQAKTTFEKNYNTTSFAEKRKLNTDWMDSELGSFMQLAYPQAHPDRLLSSTMLHMFLVADWGTCL